MTNCCHFKIYDQNKWQSVGILKFMTTTNDIAVVLSKKISSFVWTKILIFLKITNFMPKCVKHLPFYNVRAWATSKDHAYNIVHIKTRLMKMCVKCSSMNYVKTHTCADFSFFSVMSISRWITNPALFTTRVSMKMKHSQGVISGSFWIMPNHYPKYPRICLSYFFFFTSY